MQCLAAFACHANMQGLQPDDGTVILIENMLCMLRSPGILDRMSLYAGPTCRSQLVALKEESTEFGGTFISNGIERIIRMLILQRRHYIMALRRSAYLKRGSIYTDQATLLRCTCQTSIGMLACIRKPVLHIAAFACNTQQYGCNLHLHSNCIVKTAVYQCACRMVDAERLLTPLKLISCRASRSGGIQCVTNSQ